MKVKVVDAEACRFSSHVFYRGLHKTSQEESLSVQFWAAIFADETKKIKTIEK